MSDQDLCECIWGHEMAMRRLINLLRNSQTYCTDTECFQDGDPGSSQNPSNVLWMTIFCMAAFFLFVFYPRTERLTEGPSKPRQTGQDSNGAPPSPPPAST